MVSTDFVIVVVSAFLLCALAVGGGIGGGALYMPVYVSLLRDAHLAVPLAKVTTNGVAWSAFFFNLCSTHPDNPRRPLINYDVALLLEPLTLVGTILGVIANIMMSSGQVVCVLVIVLGATAYKTFKKGLEQRERELEFLKEKETYQISSPRQSQLSSPPREQTPYMLGDRNNAGQVGDTSRTQGSTPTHALQNGDYAEADVLLIDGMSTKGSRRNLPSAWNNFIGNLCECCGPDKAERRFPIEKILYMLLLWGCHGLSLHIAGGPFALMCGDIIHGSAILANVALQFLFTIIWREKVLFQQNCGGRKALHQSLMPTEMHDVNDPKSDNNRENTQDDFPLEPENYPFEMPSSPFSSRVSFFKDESDAEVLCAHLVQENLKMDERNTLMYPLLSGVVGVIAGALGVAGGLIKGPLMLYWGMASQSATATAIFMIMFTSSSTILQFILLGRLHLHLSVIFWITGFFGGLLGSQIVSRLMKKYDRQSFITLFLATLILLSGLSMSAVSILSMVGVFPSPESDSDKDFCAMHADTVVE